jgi:NhaP-type Na+/H+ or K+/H+ antiporter
MGIMFFGKRAFAAQIGMSSPSGTDCVLTIVSLPLLTLTAASPQAAASEWVLRAVLWEVGFAVGFGALLGWGAGRLLHWAEANRTIDKPSFLSYAITLAWVTLGAARILGSDGILAVFVAGVAFNRVVSAAERPQEERFAEALDRFFTLPVFLLFGLALPWSQWGAEGWPLALLALAILLQHRLPALLALTCSLRLLY